MGVMDITPTTFLSICVHALERRHPRHYTRTIRKIFGLTTFLLVSKIDTYGAREHARCLTRRVPRYRRVFLTSTEQHTFRRRARVAQLTCLCTPINGVTLPMASTILPIIKDLTHGCPVFQSRVLTQCRFRITRARAIVVERSITRLSGAIPPGTTIGHGIRGIRGPLLFRRYNDDFIFLTIFTCRSRLLLRNLTLTLSCATNRIRVRGTINMGIVGLHPFKYICTSDRLPHLPPSNSILFHRTINLLRRLNNRFRPLATFHGPNGPLRVMYKNLLTKGRLFCIICGIRLVDSWVPFAGHVY